MFGLIHLLQMGDPLVFSHWVGSQEPKMITVSIYLQGSFLSNLNYSGHKQEAMDTKLRGHLILKAANDYS